MPAPWLPWALRIRAGTPPRSPRPAGRVLPHRLQRAAELQHRLPRLQRAAPTAGLDRRRPHPGPPGARPAASDGGATHPDRHAEGVDVDAKIAALATYLGHVEVRDVYWYLSAVPELMNIVGRALRDLQQTTADRCAMRAPQIRFDQLVQDFFLRRLIDQRGTSPRTVESYRDAFELLFGYIEQRLGKRPSALTLADLDAPMILDFLDHLETMRHNSARTRNARLAAIHSFMRYAAVRDPGSLPITTRVLAIPSKRFDRPVLGHLTHEQVAAVLAAPDRTTWTGHATLSCSPSPTTPAPAYRS